MESDTIQLELEEESITIKTEVFKGVLISNTFNGKDCYLQLLKFLRQRIEGSGMKTINAAIFLK